MSTKPLLNPDLIDLANKMLRFDEGCKASPYRDSLGFWTIGVGHFIGKTLEALALSEGAIDELLSDDLRVAWGTVEKIFGREAVAGWAPARKLALLNLSFNLGEERLRKFARTIEAVKSGRWEDAAAHLADSLWAKQVKSRATRVIHMVKTGELHSSYLA
jgi:lysozyme